MGKGQKTSLTEVAVAKLMRADEQNLYAGSHRHWEGERDEAPCSISGEEVGICAVVKFLQP